MMMNTPYIAAKNSANFNGRLICLEGKHSTFKSITFLKILTPINNKI